MLMYVMNQYGLHRQRKLYTHLFYFCDGDFELVYLSPTIQGGGYVGPGADY